MEVIVRILMYDRGNVEHLPNDLGEDGEDKFQKEKTKYDELFLIIVILCTYRFYSQV